MSTPFSTLPSNVVELRRYTLHPGQRDTLIELFDTEFIKPQKRSVSQAFASDRLIALLVTLDAVNDFPVLPVRERENVIVAVVARESPDDERMLKFETPALGPRVLRTDVFRLTPTGGSRLR